MQKTQHNLIILEGGIAAGKTTLLQGLAKKYGFYAKEEPATDNPYLARFYQDPKGYAYEFQLWFLNLRIQHYQEAVDYAKRHPDRNVILDRSVYSDLVFALNCKNSGLLSEDQYASYLVKYNNAVSKFPKPVLMLYLDVSPETCLFRIKNVRKRECESWIEIGYLEGLADCYRYLMHEMNSIGCQTIVVDWSVFGKVEDIYETCQQAQLISMASE